MSIRLRLTVLVALGAALLLAAGSFGFTALLRTELVASLDANLAAQASQTAQTLPGPAGQENLQDAGGAIVGTRVPRSAGAPSEYLVQVFRPDGRLLESNQAAGPAPLVGPPVLAGARRVRLVRTERRPGGSDLVRVLAEPVAGAPGWVLVIGQSLDTTTETLANVERALVLAGILALAVATASAYLLARAALAPVERMRKQVETLAGANGTAPADAIADPGTRDELAALASTMNGLLGRLSRSLGRLSEALGREREFVADAGHELRTPLAVLRGELELASRPGRSRAELAGAVERASAEAGHISRLAEDLLVLAGADEAARGAVVDLGALVAQAVERSSARAAARGVALRLETEANLIARIEPHRVRQVVDNLLDNALRYAPPGSTVTVRARASGRALHLAVADEGPGFSPEFLPHAFERFRRADDARGRETGGSGLGLAIVDAIARAHGGRASAANTGTGALVSVELPDALVRASG